MNAHTKRILRFCLVLAVLLIFLIYIRETYFEPELKIKYVSQETRAQKELYTYTADTSLYHFSSEEGKMPASTDFFSPEFLPNFPYKIRGWVGKDIENPYADINLFRLYHHPRRDTDIWFIIVYGGHESKFHSAEVCYISDGWDVAYREIKKITIGNEQFPIRYLIAQKGKNTHVVGYWYIWKSAARRVSDGALLFRISVESARSEKEGIAALSDFMEGLVNITGLEPRKYFPVARAKISESEKEQAPPPPVIASPQEAFEKAKVQSLEWILSQRVPNKTVPLPQIDRRYLLLSYELNPDRPQNENDKNYRYIFSRSAVYDDALGLIALSMAGRNKEAENIIDAFERVMRDSGELWFGYNTHDDWPSEGNHDEAIIRNGASSWAGYAITYHLRKRLLEEPQVFQKYSSYRRYLNLAQKIADAVLKDQVLEPKDPPKDPREGFVTGGNGSFDVVWNEKENKIAEKFRDEKILWASTEHNLDLYFFLKNLMVLTRMKKYEAAMEKVKAALLRSWNETEGQFNRGLRLDGADPAMALDCASWGAMFALAIGDQKKADALFAAVDKYLVLDPIRQIKGYRPYYRGLVYDEPSINKIVYPHKPDKSWSDLPMVWSEGSLGVAMAYLKAGQKARAKAIVSEILKMQVKSGGVGYATAEVPLQFSSSPSMAGTAWLAMVLHAMEDPRLLTLFWD